MRRREVGDSHPRLVGIRVWDFDKAEDVFKQVQAAVPMLKKQLKTNRLEV